MIDYSKFNKLIFIYLLFLNAIGVYGQFYNGHQMTFGKNRVQYNDFFWSYYRYEKYDIYFNQDGQLLAEYIADYLNIDISRLESFFDYKLERRIIIMVYNKLTDLRQSNIGHVTGKDEYNIGGVITVSRNRVFVYYEGDFENFEKQISEAISKVIINEMLYGSDYMENLTNTTLMQLPSWFIDGLISYSASSWDIDIENYVRDGILTGRYKKFNRLEGRDAVYAGHSFWKYISDNYGESVIPSIIYLIRINKNLKSGFFTLGLSLKEITRNWYEHYLYIYSKNPIGETPIKENQLINRPKKKVVYHQIELHPQGKFIAYAQNIRGQYKVWIHDLETGKKNKVIKKGQKLEQIVDYTIPVLSWHPSGKILAFFTEEKGGLKLYYYNIETKNLQVRNFLYFDKIMDFSFSHDGSLMVLSAVQKGKTDIFVHTIAAGTNFKVTDDIADDYNPRFINNSSQIIFSSNRKSDTISVEKQNSKKSYTTDIFIYDYQFKSDILTRLSDSPYTKKLKPIKEKTHTFQLLSNKNGIKNRYISKFDSTINFVDTIVHYRYLARTYPLTNYSSNILDYDYNVYSGKIAETYYQDNKYKINISSSDDDIIPSEEMNKTPFRKELTKNLKQIDSLQKINIEVLKIHQIKDNTLITSNLDTFTFKDYDIDINNYIFESEKINYFNEQLKEKNIKLTFDSIKERQPRIRIYLPAFYQNTMVNQIDFSFLNESYQAFTGGAVYFNPGMNLLFKVGLVDLFEDYKITGGFRLSPDLDGNEYLLSIENLKKRWDKSFIFHRQGFKNSGFDEETNSSFLIKTHSHILSYILRYPFNQVTAFAGTFSFRNDRTVYLSDNPITLAKSNLYKNWASAKLEFIFDNTWNMGINLLGGTRYKIFAEVYQQVNDKFDNLVVYGVDYRKYVPIHRTLVWASRFAASASFGSSRLIYYLGGVDNWTNVTPLKTPTFIPLDEIPIDDNANYAFQTVATNMRGFSQNIRNGNRFMLINTEIRWPFIRYFANRPISSKFLESLMLIGFFDIGTAWTGEHPWAEKNAYDFVTIDRTTISLRIDSGRKPIVAGFGFGARMQLLGYFMRFDWAWGIENNTVLPNVFYFSLTQDF